MIDFTILTDRRYVNPEVLNDYINNVLLEDALLQKALEKLGYRVYRTNWDDETMDWNTTNCIIFRTTWDYFDRFDEFEKWLDFVSKKTRLINSKELIFWNIDKHYLKEIEAKGIRIPDTIILDRGHEYDLAKIVLKTGWKKIILKPTISGAARHTYLFDPYHIPSEVLKAFNSLIQNEDMMLQEYQFQIKEKGEVAFMMFGGEFSHAVLKMAKPGDFRVQDDFGGTLHPYTPSAQEIEFAQQVISACPEEPIYARVDILWDNSNQPAVGEIEMIEPELWFRKSQSAADLMASAISETYCRS